MDNEVPSDDGISLEEEIPLIWDVEAEACEGPTVVAGVPLDTKVPSGPGVSIDDDSWIPEACKDSLLRAGVALTIEIPLVSGNPFVAESEGAEPSAGVEMGVPCKDGDSEGPRAEGKRSLEEAEAEGDGIEEDNTIGENSMVGC